MPEEYTTLEASDGIRDATEGSRRRGKPDKGELSYVQNLQLAVCVISSRLASHLSVVSAVMDR